MAEKNFEITSSDFKETSRDGVKVFKYDGEDKLQQAKEEHFGADKLKAFTEIEKQYHDQMGDAIVNVSTDHFNKDDADKEIICSYTAGGVTNDYYIRKADEGVDVIHKQDSSAYSLVEYIGDSIWEAIRPEDEEDDD